MAKTRRGTVSVKSDGQEPSDPTDWILAPIATTDPMVSQRAVLSILDWMAVTVAGSPRPEARRVVAALAGDGHGEASIVGSASRATAGDAAFANGFVGHLLDYDDTIMALPGHATGTVLPAVLALAEQTATEGAAVVRALVCGIEAEVRLALLAGPGHYDAGFHSTGTLGSFGAAVGAATLLELDAAGCRVAFGLAASHAAGLRVQFGSLAKPVHAGRAASDGVRCALLARAGVTSASDVVTGPGGFLALYAGPASLRGHEALDEVASGPAIARTLYKRHAACHLAQSTIDNAVTVRAAGADSAAIVVTVAPEVLDVCCFDRPATGREAQFSLPFAVAAGLLGFDTAMPATFDDSSVHDASVLTILPRVRIETRVGRPLTWASLTVERDNGTTMTVECDVGRPSDSLDELERKVQDKARSLMTPVLGVRGAQRLMDAVAGIGTATTVGSLLAACRPSAELAA